MSRKPVLLALLSQVLLATASLSRPPDGPSGRMVQEDVPALQAEVKRLEKEAAGNQTYSEDLEAARARLAAAEGRRKAARAAWRKVIASREERVIRMIALAKRVDFSLVELEIARGQVAEAHCGLAEVDGDRASLAKELPKVIACYRTRLKMLDDLRKVGAYNAEETAEERAIRKELLKTRKRLDDVRQR